MEEKKTLIGRTAKVTKNVVGLDLLQQVSVAVGPGEYTVLSDPYPVVTDAGPDYLAIRIKNNAGRDVRIRYDANMIVTKTDAWSYVSAAINKVQAHAEEIAKDNSCAVFMIAVGKDGKGDLDHDGTIIGDSKLLKAMLCTAAELQPEVLALLAYAVKAVTLKKLSDTLKHN